MDVGYYKPQLMLPAPLPTQASNAPANMPPSFMSQAQGMAGPGVTNGIYAQPSNQGDLTKLAYQLAGPAPQPLPQPAMTGGPGLPMTNPGAILTGGSSSGSPGVSGKVSGAASGALAGWQLGGPFGALAGGVGGYALGGGAKDLNPIDASGFNGTSMDQAWQDQNLARLGSNPAAAVASKLGVSSDSVLGRVLDPGSLMGGHKGSHWRNWDAFNQAFPGTTVNDQGNYVLPDGQAINQQQLDDLAGTWYGATQAPDGDQAGWQSKFQNSLKSIYGDRPSILFGG